MQWILYGLLVVILGVVGYYVGKNYISVGTTLGAALGAGTGALVSWFIYSARDEGSSSSSSRFN